MADLIVDESEKARKRASQLKYHQSEKYKLIRLRDKEPAAQRDVDRRNRLTAAGLCSRCGKMPPRPLLKTCKPCSNIVITTLRARITRHVENGTCPACGRREVLPTMRGKRRSFCEECYFKKTSTDCLRTAKHAETLAQKLREQNYRCAYTGEEIILGLNDSLDHVLPISRFPHLRHDPANTQWVTRKANCMKWDSTHEEFIATAYAVVRYYESQLQSP
jgi:5-methylcytosine-specific restriction endonuclease McrA